ncbi:hypothetical protein LEP1GSC057_1371 [Leptospira interrogans str. Brem 329]|nr:hypothetical protein LEP1GSC057_1371 [Leptospira interrogans str. Brem 329]EMN66166.1 hypothetical protein LEP1GSC098_4135 [Leptospira interrogans serovar Grippotyphosa str. UI 08434]
MEQSIKFRKVLKVEDGLFILFFLHNRAFIRGQTQQGDVYLYSMLQP